MKKGKNVKAPKYEAGCLVKHRVTGEVAVVIRANTECVKHVGLNYIGFDHMHGVGCDYQFTGTYLLSRALGECEVTAWEAELCVASKGDAK